MNGVFIYIKSVIFLLFAAFATMSFAAGGSSPGYPFKPGAMRALSVSALEACLQKKSISRSERSRFSGLCGIRRLEGFALDRSRGDIVLYGWTAPDLPELRLDDFVVALRNAALIYAFVAGNTRYYASPGCSIDPDPKTMAELSRMGHSLMSTNDMKEAERLIDAWNGMCKTPQKVRVLGLPFDSRFAGILVEADYDMKLIADGSDSLGMPGFASFTGMTLSRIRECVLADKPIPPLGSMMNRFWFYPGDVQVQKTDGMYFLSDCRVRLLTEESYMDLRGQVAGGSRSDPIAQRFVDNFSDAFDRIALVRPVYRELENMFRFFALARVIADLPAGTGCGIEFLLKSYETEVHQVNAKVPGHPAMQHFEHKRNVLGGFQQISLRLPSCGGVEIAIEDGVSIVKNTDSPVLEQSKEVILRSRPSPEAVWWDCEGSAVEQLKDAM